MANRCNAATVGEARPGPRRDSECELRGLSGFEGPEVVEDPTAPVEAAAPDRGSGLIRNRSKGGVKGWTSKDGDRRTPERPPPSAIFAW